MPPEAIQELGDSLSKLLACACILPLLGFMIEVFAGYWSDRFSKTAAYIAVACIGIGFLCSVTAFCQWKSATDFQFVTEAHHGEHDAGHDDSGHHDGDADHKEDHEHHAGNEGHGHDHDADGHEESHADDGDEEVALIPHETAFSGSFYTLVKFGSLQVSVDYYIDSLTLLMYMMVTLIATCIHVFAIGYMSDELTEEYVDHNAHTADGKHVHRPGRFYRFFSYMSLFCFSMLGLVLAGNIFLVFIFWELVGICSYLLIGFYVERKSANVAANKAFIMNRIGDFGFLIGLMIIWTWFGTFNFAGTEVDGHQVPGLFEMVRGHDGELTISDDGSQVLLSGSDGELLVDPETDQPVGIPYVLMVTLGLGIFAGSVGKSAQFPLQTWLPDAMEGPTPVSALVHSATMVAAGVYLAGRFYPMFVPEVLLTIAYIGCITLFLAATIAVVATDIKRVLAYSTISQLGYMMLAIGVAGWAAGLFHLITHAFFKSLMFLSSGSVIVGCHHEQEMPRMGGLLKKMPITAIAMLVGVVAISGLAIPFTIFGWKFAFSGYHSKDAIVATSLAFMNGNPTHLLLFFVPLITAGITAFYMFRLWFYTFWGQPRDQEMHDHVHESPWVMTGPLIVLSLFAALCAMWGEQGPLYNMIVGSEPVGVAAGVEAAGNNGLFLPGHEDIHKVHSQAGYFALLAAVTGMVLAYLLYGARIIDPGEIKRQFSGVHHFLVEKWQFDTLYDAMFVRPAHVVASWFAEFDKKYIDGFLHGCCKVVIDISHWDRKFDEAVIDRFVNILGEATFATGRSLSVFQTGRLRQYIMFIAVGVLTLFVLLFTLYPV
jgi:NADH-quinone oxidoreductase subunit L